jgi:hypothetical protein
VCKNPLIRQGSKQDGIFWYEHETPAPYGPVVVIFEDDMPSIDAKKLLDLFVAYHKQLDDVRAPPGELPASGGVGGPAIEIPHDPNFKYKEDGATK